MPATLQELQSNAEVYLDYECRDIGYSVESGSGEFVYRGIEYGKYAFTEAATGQTVYLFEDEIVSLERTERALYPVKVEVFLRPTTAVTWERFALNEQQAAREALAAAEREWPDAALVRANVVGEAVTS